MRKTEITDMTGYFRNFSTDEQCREYLIGKFWSNGPVCPHCGNLGKIYVYKTRDLCKCAECKKQFSITTGTIYADSNLPLHKMFLAVYLITTSKKGVSSTHLGRLLGISQKSAWYLAHKIRSSFKRTSTKKLSKTVEVDETFIGGRKKGFMYKGRSVAHKTPVFGMIERKGELIIMPVINTKRKTLEPIILGYVEKGTKIMSDEWWAYTKLKRYYEHEMVKHRAREYVRGNVHTNSIEGAWSQLKKALNGTHVRPSRKHLAKYCDEFQFKFNTRTLKDFERFEKAIQLSQIHIKQRHITL